MELLEMDVDDSDFWGDIEAPEDRSWRMEVNKYLAKQEGDENATATLKHGNHNQLSHGNRYGKAPSLARARRLKDSSKEEWDRFVAKYRLKNPRPERKPSEPKKPLEPAGTPVGDAFVYSSNSKTIKSAKAGIAEIEKVHGDGDLPDVPLTQSTSGKFHGQLATTVYMTGDVAYEIKVSTKGDHTELTVAHEIGHLLDKATIDTGASLGRGFASTKSTMPEIKALNEAFDNSTAIKTLTDAYNNPTKYQEVVTVPYTNPYTNVTTEYTHTLKPDKNHLNYLLSRPEIFARGYSQYIANRSGSATMQEQVGLVRQNKLYGNELWSDEDFAPIATAFDNLMKAKGWRQ